MIPPVKMQNLATSAHFTFWEFQHRSNDLNSSREFLPCHLVAVFSLQVDMRKSTAKGQSNTSTATSPVFSAYFWTHQEHSLCTTFSLTTCQLRLCHATHLPKQEMPVLRA